MAVFDPSMTANKVADMLPKDAMNASGKPNGADAPEVPGFVQTKGYIDARRKGKAASTLAPEIEAIREKKKVRVRIFNVGPFTHIVPLGSIGTAVIPACPEGKPYVEMLTPLFEVQDEIYPKTRNSEPKRLYEEGKKIAIEILGEGRNQNKRQSRRRTGVFIAAGDTPTEKELRDANAELHVYASEQILFMDTLWDRDRKLAYDVYRPESFGACARILGLTGREKGWLAQGTPSNKVPCRYCTEPVDPNAPICSNCKNIVNRDRYLELKAEDQALEEATAPKKNAK